MALFTWAFVILVLLMVAVLLVVKITRGATTVPRPPVAPASPAVVHSVTSLPQAAFDAAGGPDLDGPPPAVLSGQPSLTEGGRPEVVFVGGEFCPYCAAARWALVAALGRFGTFSTLGATSSSKFEVFPGTATFSFQGASFHSRYVGLLATESYGQKPSTVAPAGFPRLPGAPGLEQALLGWYDNGGSSTGGDSSTGGGSATLPFIDVDNRLVVRGAEIGFSPALLQGKSMDAIAGELSDPTSPVGEAVLGEANALTAAICSATGNMPRAVCESAGVHAAAAILGLR
jgi:Domain of unknown function (DUF929)